jgi:AcrR family transcriptional regulator
MESISDVTRRERKKQETRQKIVKIAMYFFLKQGFDSTTMEQIAEEVDISKATLYNYFPVKEAIISEYWQNNVKEIKLQILKMIQLLPDTKSRVQKTFNKAATELFKSKQDIYKIYLSYWLRNLNNPSLNERLRSGFEDIFTMIIKLGQQSGDIRRDTDVELLVKYLEVIFLTACINWLSDPKLFPLEKTLTQTVSLFIEGAGSGSRKSKSKIDGKDSAQGSLL